MEEKSIIRLSELTKLSGYLIAGGALVGFSVGIWRVFNHAFFSFFVEIAEFEAMNYFLAVFMPSFIILIIIGYLFTTTFGLKKLEISNVTPLCLLGLISIVLSALSIFYFVSLVGGLFVLMVLVGTYTKPSFNHFSADLAFFLVETGALLMLAFSTLFLSMWAISNFFVTYAIGFFGSYSPLALFLVGVFSVIMFFAVPLWGSRGTHSGMNALIGFSLSFLWYVFIIQNQYVLFSTPAYIGLTFLFVGFGLALAGSVMYLSLFFSAPNVPIVPATSILFQGKYCPNCGSHRATAVQKLCSICGRNLMWTPLSPFCSACGRVVPSNVQACPHCFDDIRNKRIQFELTLTQEQETAQKWVAKSKEKPWIITNVVKVLGNAKLFLKPVVSLSRMFNTLLNRVNLTVKEALFIMILTYVFGFIAFISYVRVDYLAISRGFLVTASYGFPAEWLYVKSYSYPILHSSGVDVLPAWLIVDVILYFLAAFLIVYGIKRLRH